MDPFVRGFIKDQKRRKSNRFVPETVISLNRVGYLHPLSITKLSGRTWVYDRGIIQYGPTTDQFDIFFEFEADALVFKLAID